MACWAGGDGDRNRLNFPAAQSATWFVGLNSRDLWVTPGGLLWCSACPSAGHPKNSNWHLCCKTDARGGCGGSSYQGYCWDGKAQTWLLDNIDASKLRNCGPIFRVKKWAALAFLPKIAMLARRKLVTWSLAILRIMQINGLLLQNILLITSSQPEFLWCAILAMAPILALGYLGGKRSRLRKYARCSAGAFSNWLIALRAAWIVSLVSNLIAVNSGS